MRQTILRRAPEFRRRLLLAVVFLGPLLFMRNLHEPINLPKLWLVMVAVAIVGGLRVVELLQGSPRSSLGLLLVPAGAILVPLAIGWVFSPYRGWALMGAEARYTGLIPYLVIVMFGILLADAFVGDVRSIAWALVVSGGVAGAYALVQVLGLDPFDWSYNAETSNLVTSTLGNPNFAGGFFAIALPVAVGLALVEKERRSVAYACTAFIILGWVVTRSETAWGAGLAGLAILAGGSLVARFSWSRIVGFALAAVIALAGVGLVMLSVGPVDAGVTPRNLERRGEWWEASFDLLADSPLVGKGPNSFAIEHTKYRTLQDVDEAGFGGSDDPHSVPLSLGVAAGVFGLIGFIVLGGWVVRTTWTVTRSEPLVLAFGAAGCAYLVQSLLSIDTVALRLTFWTVAAGLAAGLTVPQKKYARPKHPSKRAAARSEPLRGLPGVALVLIVAMVALWWATKLLAVDAAVAGARTALKDGETQAAQDRFERALGFRNNDAYARVYAETMTPVAVALAENDAEEPARQVFALIEQGLEDAVPRASNALTLARAYKQWSDVDPTAETAALQEYEQAATLDPRNYLLLQEAAETARSFDELDRATEFLTRALELTNRAELWGDLAFVHAQAGDEKAAEAAIGEALALDPDEASALEARGLLD